MELAYGRMDDTLVLRGNALGTGEAGRRRPEPFEALLEALLGVVASGCGNLSGLSDLAHAAHAAHAHTLLRVHNLKSCLTCPCRN